jgi:glycosyltransferase involved in cell wall biosynthesis
VIPNGIDPFWLKNVPAPMSEAQSEKLARKELDVIVAGRINKNKNQTAIMKAVDILNAEGWTARLTVVGGTEDEDVVNELKKNPAVTVVSAQPKEKLMEYYRQSDVFAMASYQETFGLVYAEAMSQGLPVLYTRGQGFDGQFPEGTVGYPIGPDDPHEIARRIVDLTADYKAVRSRVPELAKQFNWDDITHQYTLIYDRICRKR